ncbi:MAG: type II toxin-antitoxin system RelE/ParE family toxin [Terracidiphilus sp.]
MIALRVSEAAALSIVEQADYYRQKADAALSLRWEAAIDGAFRALLKLSGGGAPCRLRSPGLSGLRWVFVPGFPKHMIFYRHVQDEQCIHIVQVLHGARNLELILNEEPDSDVLRSS